MAKDVEVVTPTWISAVGRRSMGMGIGAERSVATSGVILPSKRDDAQLLRLWMSERVSVASEENPGGWVVESVALMIVAAVRDRALALSGVWRPPAVRKSNFLLDRRWTDKTDGDTTTNLASRGLLDAR